ncbi:hypothetical protein EJ05DRAFT_511287 [Pseudovirgaria hyperparasitica]|uniref:Zn(2)-C6 fungal-type domain-containing protein n=1 Tax=Pseudovirgaria hyperparasitica TaxID=470096 RepID=A0A6A6W4K4_9PEZI|nr:uncharacterized protein EJ05DRAFT_511287 [Pseudovirgaria hyperparasitica]KAF2757485.1 hypothetical protein EJ05DRAFT_511287 [Pseudovirgaria hyperparasitica]
MSSLDHFSSATKQAACLHCRRSKVKCKRDQGDVVCERCQNAGLDCSTPGQFHVGRQKGVKNKRSGLEKAVFQIEEALKKSRNDPPLGAASNTELHRLLDEARSRLSSSAQGPTGPIPDITPSRHSLDVDNQQLALDDAENPLQLLARASDLQLSSPQGSTQDVTTPSNRRPTISGPQITPKAHRFFRPMRATNASEEERHNDLDPIDLGLVTIDEAEMLTSFFHRNLAHTRWGLDPFLYTLDFIRKRSSFLLTSIMAASSLFISYTDALAKRLSIHTKVLAQRVIAQRLRSVEIVLAFIVNIPWMPPGDHSADDDTGLYLATAMSIALDLSLDKIILPSSYIDRKVLDRIPNADCIDARKALTMDGFDGVDPSTEWGRRLCNNRERIWIALFVLERGVCLARGRRYTVPISPLINHCDKFHTIDIAIPGDRAMISMSVLRRDLDGLFSEVRLRCDSFTSSDNGSNIARDIERSIEKFFDSWLIIWTAGKKEALPPYVEVMITSVHMTSTPSALTILCRHTKLSTYTKVMNHPTAPLEVKRLFRASALSSALNVMRAVVQSSSQLASMPNNTCIMLAFAACMALNLCTGPSSGGANLAPSIAQLIEEAADVLERLGTTPKHRRGQSVYYGEYLRDLVRQAPVPLPATAPPPAENPKHAAQTMETVFSSGTQQAFHTLQNSNNVLWGEPLHFSAMSDDQINEAIGQGFDTTMSETSGLWLDWNDMPEFGFQ